jgi:hypothetical protein
MFNIAKNRQPLYCKNNCQVDCHWCSCPYLLKFVVPIHKCTFQASQVLVTCANDMNHYMGGMKRKYTIDRPMVPSICRVQEGTNLS